MAVVVASLALVACGGDDDESSGDGSPGPQAVGEDLGCDPLEEVETEELYVREEFHCTVGGEVSRLYTFNTSSARDSWREIADEFGVVVLDVGDTWLHVEGS